MPKRHGFTFEHGRAARAWRSGARARAARRRERLRLRRVGGLRPHGDGAQGQARHHRAQPRPQRSASSVYFGERPKARRGHASTSDLSPRGARADGRCRARDRAPHRRGRLRGPARRRSCSRASTPDLDLFHPWALSHRGGDRPRQALRGGGVRRCRRRSATRKARRVSAQHSQFVLANSLGFIGGYPGSRHYLSCAVIAEDKGLMQRDDWYSALARARRSSPTRARSAATPAARRRAPGRAQDRHLPGAGAVRGAGGASASSATSSRR